MLIFAFTLGFNMMIAGMLGYSEPLPSIFIIVLLASSLRYLYVLGRKLLFGLSLISVVGVGGVAYYLYRTQQIQALVSTVTDFLRVYWLSITLPNITINGLHQQVIIGTTAFLVSLVLHLVLVQQKKHSRLVIIGLFAFVLMGIVLKLSNTYLAHQGFYIIAITSIASYLKDTVNTFYKDHYKKQALGLYALVFVMAIVGVAHVAYTFEKTPFIREKTYVTVGAIQGSEFSFEEDDEEADTISQLFGETSTIQETFEHKNIQLMKVKTSFLSYIKAEVYENYTSGVWSKNATMMQAPADNLIEHPDINPLEFENYYELDALDIQLAGIKTNILFTGPYLNHDIFIEGAPVIRYDASRGTYTADDLLPDNFAYQLRAISPKYGVKTFVDFIKQNQDQAVPSVIQNATGRLQDPLPQVTALAQDITQGLEGTYDKAKAIEDYLRNNYTYNEAPPAVPEGMDPVDHFLFTSTQGFCQQFSSSMVLMLRALDIPARYATGYYVEPLSFDDFEALDAFEGGQELDPADQFVTVYDNNAHTWVEVYVPQVGWLVFEPTPGRYYAYSDQEDYAFEDPATEEDLQEDMSPSSRLLPVEVTLILVLVSILGVVVLVVYRFMARKKRLKTLPINDKIMRRLRVVHMYLAQLKLEKQTTETHREFSARIHAHPQMANYLDYMALAHIYEHIVFGEKQAKENDLEEINDYLNDLKLHFKFEVFKLKYYFMVVVEYFLT